MGKKIGKYDVPLKAAHMSVERALKKLKKIRPLATTADQEKIDLEIRELKKAAQQIWIFCHIRRFHRAPSKKRK